ncbi:MAG: protein-glutamate O-methyltransferase CheR [Alphaproteobacteria bacterium]|nr:protein-glutamate O-methyltransferase CheR [Alphaproteobacteria bacterium]
MDVDLTISDEDVARFCEFLYRRTGIRLDAGKRYFTDRRITDRIVASGARNFRDWFQTLHFQSSGEEMQQLINAMTVNETYFFRESYQFDCLVNSLLDEVARRKHRPGDRIRIWSVPCSTGEEPYSIAISLLEKWGRADEFDIEILASDIDSKVLAQARAGVYDNRVVGKVPDAWLRKYFQKIGDDRWKIIDSLRSSIEWNSTNICDASQTWRYRDIDVIFCRNLLIYFDDQSRRQALDLFHEAMAPGGFICLGHSESMNRMSSLFIPRKFPDALVHQKPVGSR